MFNNSSFENFTVLITGASSETGPFIARAFADAGANLALTYYSNKEAAQSIAASSKQKGVLAEIYHLDLLSEQSIKEFISQIKKDWPSLDVIILNAGSKGLRNFRYLNWEQLHTAYDGNVKGNFMLAKELGFWIKDKWDSLSNPARIIQLTAQSAENTSHSAYGMAKAAQREMAAYLAYNLAPELTVNTIQPIGINQNEEDDFAGNDPAPLGRKVHAREIARMCLLMCDPAFNTVTGEVIRMDSGRHILPNIEKKL